MIAVANPSDIHVKVCEDGHSLPRPERNNHDTSNTGSKVVKDSHFPAGQKRQ